MHPPLPARTGLCAACHARGSFPEKGCHADEKSGPQVVLTEGAILGGGAFSRVSIVSGQPPGSLPRSHLFTWPLIDSQVQVHYGCWQKRAFPDKGSLM